VHQKALGFLQRSGYGAVIKSLASDIQNAVGETLFTILRVLRTIHDTVKLALNIILGQP